MKKFENKTVLITGGTSGIGAETARQFCNEGARVIIVGRNYSRAEAIMKNVEDSSQIEFFQLDVTDYMKVEELAQIIQQKYGGIDVLFNNAGIYPGFGKFEESDVMDWNNIINVNVCAMVEICKVFLPLLKSKKGKIINNASIAGLQDFTSGSGYAYAASKSAIIKFTKMLAKNYAKDIRVNCICPGVIDTPLYLNLNREKMVERTPAGRVGEPKDIASVVLFLASDESSFIYGAVLPIDGGMTL